MTAPARPGFFVVSLDFELHWGVRDHTSISAARDRLLGARDAVKAMLALFERRSIHATWATVGMLFAHDREELLRFVPEERPRYRHAGLSAYEELPKLGRDERDDPFHFAGSLVDLVARTPGQELATHTFSHFYCLEEGATAEAFAADLAAARAIGAAHGDVVRSLVFPRNQVNPAFVPALRAAGVKAYRVNPARFPYNAGNGDTETTARRAARLLDTYLPITGSRVSTVPSRGEPAALVATAFLRPYSRRLAPLDGLRLRRLVHEMRDAARTGRTFHLWWHPHNFGRDLRENLRLLEHLLDELDVLRRREGMQSVTMAEALETRNDA
jgi:peptidoglycan/xylan/chitin deacetylase (PgdA/CDA1 family)